MVANGTESKDIAGIGNAGWTEGPRTSAERSAQLLFQDPQSPVDFEARDENEARRAVEEFARLFEAAPGVFKRALDGARAGAETLSGDRLQGLAEIIQNADDEGASFVHFRVVSGHLVAVHDGRPVTLSDVLSLATPWLSNKIDDVFKTGRFGIGLMTLRGLSDLLDVHSGPYHVRIGDPTICAIGPEDLPVEPPDLRATSFCLPLRDPGLDADDLVTWLDRWDDSALLFLRYVRAVTVFGHDSTPVRTLSLAWSDERSVRCHVDGRELSVQRRQAAAPDGRRWLVHSADARKPANVSRVGKAAGQTVPLGLALPLNPDSQGMIYAGLPVAATRVPLRVNAQFDPVTSRTGLAPTPWNQAMLPMLADFWVEILEDLFAAQPKAAWHVVPLPADLAGDGDATAIVSHMEGLLLDRARGQLAERAAVTIEGANVPLTDLAVEATVLENVIEPGEVAALADLALALPAFARDAADRWRSVLDDWRAAGAALPQVVTVEDALTLLGDESRTPAATITLTSVALSEGFADELAGLRCVVAADGAHAVPPTAESLWGLVVTRSPLAEQLGIGMRLAEEHLAETEAARTVLAWLGQIGAVIGADNDDVVRRLAAAGRAGTYLSEQLTDDQLRGLRDAIELVPPGERSSLARDVGRAITVAAYSYDHRGQIVHASARPAELYISRAIDREPDNFALAAGKTPGLFWTHNRYADQLRSSLGRIAGLGPQRFLGLLGAERTPRLVPHPGLYARYVGARLGLPIGSDGSPAQRDRALSALSATYTLDDIDSPDLRTVVVDIARERNAARRRDRANALLGVLGRAWDRLEESAEVIAASTDYGWRRMGSTRAFWLWSVGAVAWLDDTDGEPRPPLDLRLKTPGTIAVHGSDAPGYLRPEFDAPNRREVLHALGVAGEPSTRDLVARLRQLRGTQAVSAVVATDAAIVYQALADRLTSRITVPGDLSERDMRTAFADGEGLLHTNLGWRTPAEVLAGPPVFGRRHPFVPQVPRADRLWATLRIRQPSLEDCLRVIGQVARARRSPEGDDVIVLLETLRLLSDRIAAASDLQRQTIRRLGKLAVWTTLGWTTDRPVYAVDDPALIDGIGAEVAAWQPGGELAQFESLLGPLRITRLGADAATVIDPVSGQRDDDATELLSTAASLLHEDLARNEPRVAATLTVSWDLLRDFEVRIDPDLRVQVDGLVGRPPLQIEVATKADSAAGVLFLRERRLLQQVDGGGRAIAGLFSIADRRQIAHAWLVACIAAEEGRTAQRLELAGQRAADERARNAREMAERATLLGQEIANRHGGRVRRRQARPHESGSDGQLGASREIQPSPKPRPRVLVDPSTLVVGNPESRPGGTKQPRRPARRHPGSSGLPDPNRNAAPPRGRTAAPSFTLLDKETVGLELARLVLADDREEIVDLRAQRGVGADAIDGMGRFFDLKVHLGDEPDSIHLEDSQIRRALTTPDYFLVVISNVEGADARPKVRIIMDPVHQLAMSRSSSVIFTGVRSAEHSLIYNLEPAPDEDVSD